VSSRVTVTVTLARRAACKGVGVKCVLVKTSLADLVDFHTLPRGPVQPFHSLVWKVAFPLSRVPPFVYYLSGARQRALFSRTEVTKPDAAYFLRLMSGLAIAKQDDGEVRRIFYFFNLIILLIKSVLVEQAFNIKKGK